MLNYNALNDNFASVAMLVVIWLKFLLSSHPNQIKKKIITIYVNRIL